MAYSRAFITSGVAALALMVGGCKGNSAASTPTQAGTTTGEVVSAKYDEVVLKQQGAEKPLRLVADPATQVVMEGRIVMVEQLPEGALVRASYDASGKATRIEHLPKDGGAPAPPASGAQRGPSDAASAGK